MIQLSISKNRTPQNILCLGAHCDDIEIGCGATILKLVEQNPAISVTWIVFSSTDVRRKEAEQSAKRFLDRSGSTDVRILDFRNGYFPYCGAEIKDCFEKLKENVEPDIIFTHFRSDLHQDHRVISELTWNTFRDHWILEYEIPKYDGDLGSPNSYVSLRVEHVQQKTETITRCFASQSDHHWFSSSTFEGLMRLRGIECNSKSGYAEAFYARKTTIL